MHRDLCRGDLGRGKESAESEVEEGEGSETRSTSQDVREETSDGGARGEGHGREACAGDVDLVVLIPEREEEGVERIWGQSSRPDSGGERWAHVMASGLALSANAPLKILSVFSPGSSASTRFTKACLL